MSANTVFLQQHSNQLYYAALAQQRAAFEAEMAEMEKMMKLSFCDDVNRDFELIDIEKQEE